MAKFSFKSKVEGRVEPQYVFLIFVLPVLCCIAGGEGARCGVARSRGPIHIRRGCGCGVGSRPVTCIRCGGLVSWVIKVGCVWGLVLYSL